METLIRQQRQAIVYAINKKLKNPYKKEKLEAVLATELSILRIAKKLKATKRRKQIRVRIYKWVVGLFKRK